MGKLEFIKIVISAYLCFGIIIGILIETALYYRRTKLFSYRKPTPYNCLIGLLFWPTDVYNHILKAITVYRLKRYRKQLLENAAKLIAYQQEMQVELKKLEECRKQLSELLKTKGDENQRVN